MNNDGHGADRDSIARTARELRDNAAKHGTQISEADARRKVERAVEQGDRKRENGNR